MTVFASSIFGDVAGWVGNLLGGAASAAAGSVITFIAKAIIGSLAHVVEWSATLWLSTPSPTLANQAGTAIGTTAWLQNELLPFTGMLAALSLLVGGAKIALSSNPGGDARGLASWLMTFAVASTAGVAVAALLIEGCDQLAVKLVAAATRQSDFGTHMAQSLGLVAQSVGHATKMPQAGFLVGLATTDATAILAIFVAGVALLASLVEWGFMLFRGGVLVVLAGVIPLAAAYSNVPTGERWLRRIAGWIVALAVYKPAAAAIYGVSFMLAGTGQNFSTVLMGVVLLFVALAALPALLRLVMPASEHFNHHRGSAAVAGATVSAASGAAALAGGAAAAAGGAAAGGSSGGGGGGGGGGSSGGGGGGGAGPTGSAPSSGGSPGGGGAGGAGAGGAGAGGAAAGSAAMAAVSGGGGGPTGSAPDPSGGGGGGGPGGSASSSPGGSPGGSPGSAGGGSAPTGSAATQAGGGGGGPVEPASAPAGNGPSGAGASDAGAVPGGGDGSVTAPGGAQGTSASAPVQGAGPATPGNQKPPGSA